MALWLFIFMTIRYFVSVGEVFWVVLCWVFYIALKKKHVLIVATLMVLFGGALIFSLYQANKQVIAFHQQVMEEIEDNPDCQYYLTHNTIAPSTLLSVVDDIAEVR
ncbi:hypothetical protein [Lysinibacillus sp. ZYM-1]|uniref:hypothetical protein n=1 Tax=Lysinibacillus sp. ZYM-1 TaxID=1681184 RepID=UPI000B2AC264|nr:hypothetical protein [Lysinibacillus sp. ZYM-1]